MYTPPSSKADQSFKQPPHALTHSSASPTPFPIPSQAMTRQLSRQDLTDSMSTSPSALPHLQKQIGNQAVAQMMLKATTSTSSLLPSVPIQRKLIIDGKKPTPAQLLQAFAQVDLQNDIWNARQQHKVDLQLFTAILQQEIDENDQIISFTQDQDVAKQHINQIASNVLQKLAAAPVMEKDGHKTDIFYDAVEQPVMREDVLPRLTKWEQQLDIFPADLKNKWLSYHQIVSLSQADQPILLDARTVENTLDEMDNYLIQYKKNLEAMTQRVESDPMLTVVAPQVSEYLNGFKYVSTDDLIYHPLKNINDNLVFLTRRLDGLYDDMREMNTAPVVYLHSTAAGTIKDNYISMVHNNWNAGRDSPSSKEIKHIHVNGYSENVIYTMKNGGTHLYIQGYVGWHLDKSMSGQQVKATQTIEDYHKNLNSFSIYMKYEDQWISQQQWYTNAAAKYLATFPI